VIGNGTINFYVGNQLSSVNLSTVTPNATITTSVNDNITLFCDGIYIYLMQNGVNQYNTVFPNSSVLPSHAFHFYASASYASSVAYSIPNVLFYPLGLRGMTGLTG
jgi:ketopantoate reductase